MTEHTKPLLLGDALQNAAVVCVVTHGRGQSPEMMAEHIVSRLNTNSVAYILPRAASGNWYDARAIDPLTDKTRDQLANSLEQLKQAAAMARTGVPVVMVGFSQGACLTLEYAFRFGSWRGAMFSLTGCRVGVPADERLDQGLGGLPIYLSGADRDPWIPLASFAQASLELGAARARLRTDVFPGRAHEVSDTEIAVLQSALDELVSGKEVQW
jgi:phospholipase/carboxylesterase